jgi:hypothetical protein
VAGLVLAGEGNREGPEQVRATGVALDARLPVLPIPAPAATAPTRPTVPTSAAGTFDIAPGTSAAGTGVEVSYRVEVENGLPYEPEPFARAVEDTLTDERGWTGRGYRLARTDTASLRVVLASPATTDRLCAPLQTRGKVSCRNGNVVAINALRWAEGADSYGDDLAGYRTYVINHEFGHALERGHEPCPGPGQPAPIMLQQTLGLDGCTANPWP